MLVRSVTNVFIVQILWGKNKHVPNYVVVQKVCHACENRPLSEKCSTCGVDVLIVMCGTKN